MSHCKTQPRFTPIISATLKVYCISVNLTLSKGSETAHISATARSSLLKTHQLGPSQSAVNKLLCLQRV